MEDFWVHHPLYGHMNLKHGKGRTGWEGPFRTLKRNEMDPGIVDIKICFL